MNARVDLICDPKGTPALAAEPRFFDERDSSSGQLAETRHEVGPANVLRFGEIVELILKDRRRLDRLSQATDRKIDLASRLLAISLGSFALFGLAMSLTFYAAHLWPRLESPVEWLKSPRPRFVEFVDVTNSRVAGHSARLIVAYGFGLIAASGICLPSLYFYGLLSGLRMTMTDVVIHSLKCTAVAAVALIGILPVYSALALGAVVFPALHDFVRIILILGLCLPFIGGLWGTRSLFLAFANLCHTMPPEFQNQRACFLRRLILSWCGCYSAVAPLMIVTLWRNLAVWL